MKGTSAQHQVVVEEGDKEKRRRRRTNRRSKQNTPTVAGSGSSLVEGSYGQGTKCFGNDSSSNGVLSFLESFSSGFGLARASKFDGHDMVRASDVAFSSMPTIHSDSLAESSDFGGGLYPYPSQRDLEGRFLAINSISCPEPISFCRKITVSSSNKEGDLDMMQKTYFAPHWSIEAVNEAIEKGNAFKASFRVNAHNRLEAYCTLDGVPTDILISGVAAQNRAIDGDIVAVMLDSVTSWTRMKGSGGHLGSSLSKVDSNVVSQIMEVVGDNSKGKDKVDYDSSYPFCRDGPRQEQTPIGEFFYSEMGTFPRSSSSELNGKHSTSFPSNSRHTFEQVGPASALQKICALISSFPLKRPTGKVLAILEKSPRRNAVIGFLGVKQLLSYKEGYKKEVSGVLSKLNENSVSFSSRDYIQLTPTDPKFPKMMVSVRSLPECIEERLEKGDETVEMELVATRIDEWKEESFLPQAEILHVLGRSGEIEPHIAAIIFENMIYNAKFSPESLACFPSIPWEIPEEELQRRKDLRNLCTFTIDPPSGSEHDDALSIEKISDDMYRVGVHIADVTYFVLPGSNLDMEAQIRSTSVYLLQHKLPMLPSQLSAGLSSLNPGVDRVAISMLWEINLEGNIVDQWIGHTVIRSCCKLSYSHCQSIIDGSFSAENYGISHHDCPLLHGQYEWPDVINSVRALHVISKKIKENRFRDGALSLESSKRKFLFDEGGVPYDYVLCEIKDSNYLVEEFMLLANRTAATVISRAFPDSALLRRHPEPNLKLLREFEAFCSKHGFELDTSSSGQFQVSLWKIREKLKSDPVLFDILISYASRPMQLAAYFCTADLRERENEWAHYSLAVPFYTHFTSPLRRYPDIIVHRTLAAALEAEKMYLQLSGDNNKNGLNGCASTRNCFTGLNFDYEAANSAEGKEALVTAALKQKVPGSNVLSDVAAYCNKRMLATRHAEDAGDKLYLWALLKKKELISDARVLGLGPKFMSVYVQKLAMERRIYYDEVEGLIVDWLETTSTLVINLSRNKRLHRRGSPGKFRPLEEVAFVINPGVAMVAGKDINQEDKMAPSTIGLSEDRLYHVDKGEIHPAVFPLTLRLLSSVPVTVHAAGGEGSPLDIRVRLYMSSYFSR